MSYVTKGQIERAMQLDLLTYLQCFEPYELVRCSRNAYSTRTHDSFKISNGKWFWWSQGIGERSARLRSPTICKAIRNWSIWYFIWTMTQRAVQPQR